MPSKRIARAGKAGGILTGRANFDSEAKFRLLIEHYAKNGKLYRACEAAGIEHSTHWRRMQSDPAYRAAVEEARTQITAETNSARQNLQESSESLADQIADRVLTGKVGSAA